MNLILTAQFPEDELDSHHQYLWSDFDIFGFVAQSRNKPTHEHSLLESHRNILIYCKIGSKFIHTWMNVYIWV